MFRIRTPPPPDARTLFQSCSGIQTGWEQVRNSVANEKEGLINTVTAIKKQHEELVDALRQSLRTTEEREASTWTQVGSDLDRLRDRMAAVESSVLYQHKMLVLSNGRGVVTKVITEKASLLGFLEHLRTSILPSMREA